MSEKSFQIKLKENLELLKNLAVLLYPLSIFITYLQFSFSGVNIFIFLNLFQILALSFTTYTYLFFLFFAWYSYISFEKKIVDHKIEFLSPILFLCFTILISFSGYIYNLSFPGMLIGTFMIGVLHSSIFYFKKNNDPDFSMKDIFSKKNKKYEKVTPISVCLLLLLLGFLITSYDPKYDLFKKKCIILTNEQKVLNSKLLFENNSSIFFYNFDTKKTMILRKELINSISCDPNNLF